MYTTGHMATFTAMPPKLALTLPVTPRPVGHVIGLANSCEVVAVQLGMSGVDMCGLSKFNFCLVFLHKTTISVRFQCQHNKTLSILQTSHRTHTRTHPHTHTHTQDGGYSTWMGDHQGRPPAPLIRPSKKTTIWSVNNCIHNITYITM
jgi:hypothetical protein